MKGAEGLRVAGFASTDATEQVARPDRLHGELGLRRGGEVELVELLAAEHGQPRLELLAARRGEDGA